MGQRTNIDWHGRNPVMGFRVLEPVDEDLYAPRLADVDSTDRGPYGPDSSTSTSSSSDRDPSGSSGFTSQQSFPRQARLP